MNWKKLILPIFFIICFILTISSITSYNKKEKILIEKYNKQIEYYKELANMAQEQKDSIIYNIHYIDSTITELKKEYIHETEVIKNLDDTSTVNLFRKLVWTE